MAEEVKVTEIASIENSGNVLKEATYEIIPLVIPLFIVALVLYASCLSF
jgi:hypothetical protein